MKKIIAVLVTVAVCSATVFAAPVVSTQTTTSLSARNEGFGTALDDGLFAEVDAVPLTSEQAAQVEGEGPIVAIISASLVAFFIAPIIAKQVATEQMLAGRSPGRAFVNGVSAGVGLVAGVAGIFLVIPCP